MIKRHNCPINGISFFPFGIFMVIATLTSQCQIIERIGSTVMDGHNMLNRKGLCGKINLAQTIFATPLGSFNDAAPLLGSNAWSRHKQAGECLTVS
jgi:hypothetical protein